jgi:hypothetical protein
MGGLASFFFSWHLLDLPHPKWFFYIYKLDLFNFLRLSKLNLPCIAFFFFFNVVLPKKIFIKI